LSNAEKLFHSTAYGTAEALGEFVTGGILNKNFKLLKAGLKNSVKRAAAVAGTEAAAKVATELSKKQAKEIFKEYGVDILKEAGSEGFTQIVQMGTDDLMGLTDYTLTDYIDQGTEAMALGAVGGTIMGLPTAAKGVKRFVDEKIRKDKGASVKATVDNRVPKTRAVQPAFRFSFLYFLRGGRRLVDQRKETARDKVSLYADDRKALSVWKSPNRELPPEDWRAFPPLRSMAEMVYWMSRRFDL